MKLRPDTLGMTAILAMLTALGPLSTDMYLPSLPAIATALGTDVARAQLTLSGYLVGFAAGQIFYGPVSDKIGRKPTVLAGLALYCLASAACALAQSVEMLIAARVVQALGAAGPIVLGRAIVRDLYEGPRAGRELSRMGMIMGLVPAIAPIIGGILEPLFGWRSNFWAVLGGAAALALAVILFLPETLRQKRPEPISLLGIFRGFGVLLRTAASAFTPRSALSPTPGSFPSFPAPPSSCRASTACRPSPSASRSGRACWATSPARSWRSAWSAASASTAPFASVSSVSPAAGCSCSPACWRGPARRWR